MTGITERSRSGLVRLPALGALLLAAGLLVGCGSPAAPSGGSAAEADADGGALEPGAGAEPTIEPEPVTPAGLEETDFGNLTWTFMLGANRPERTQLDMVDGKAMDGPMEFSVGEVVLSELNGDDRIDAAVALSRADGNAFEEQWYLWLATDDGPRMVTMPIAHTSRCGTAIHSVTAADGGGVVVHESRRAIGEDMSLACVDVGSDERTRTVSAIEIRNSGEWWPVQTAPVGGFGGICPVAADYHADPYTGPMYAGPDTGSPEVTGGDQVTVFPLEPWPVYGEDFPGWQLVGLIHDGVMACAWAETS